MSPTANREELEQEIERLREEVRTRRLEDAARHESEGRYLVVLEAAPDPVIVYDLAGKVTYLNPGFTRVFGWALDDLVDGELHFVPKANIAETLDAVERVQRGEKIVSKESRRRTKDGRVLDVVGNISIINDRDGKMTGSVVALRDVTDSKRMDNVPSHEADKARSAVEKTLAGENVLYEAQQLTRDSRLLNVQLKSDVFKDTQG